MFFLTFTTSLCVVPTEAPESIFVRWAFLQKQPHEEGPKDVKTHSSVRPSPTLNHSTPSPQRIYSHSFCPLVLKAWRQETQCQSFLNIHPHTNLARGSRQNSLPGLEFSPCPLDSLPGPLPKTSQPREAAGRKPEHKHRCPKPHYERSPHPSGLGPAPLPPSLTGNPVHRAAAGSLGGIHHR